MGSICSFNQEDNIPTMQRLRYDMSRVVTANPIIIWFLGPPGSGKTTQVKSLCQKMDLADINVDNLLLEESREDTDRGKIFRDVLKKRGKAPDELVVDVVKEALLRSPCLKTHKGFIITNFPLSKKQAKLFIQEVKDVDAVIYLFAHYPTLLSRIQVKSGAGKPIEHEMFRKVIADYTKDVNETLSGMKAKVEKIFTDAPVSSIKKQIEAALMERINLKPVQSDNIETVETEQPEKTESSTL